MVKRQLILKGGLEGLQLGEVKIEFLLFLIKASVSYQMLLNLENTGYDSTR